MDFYDTFDTQCANTVQPYYNFSGSLFHYTNLETLALILKNRTFRFSELSVLDDKQEQILQKAKNAERYTFVSCWTDEPKESIPMWKMYSRAEQGLRIEMTTYPFEDVLEDKAMCCIYDQETNQYKFLNNLEAKNVDFFSCVKRYPVYNKLPLVRIMYTDDERLLFPIESFRYTDNPNVTGVFPVAGLYKNTHWEFQKELRYIITFSGPNDYVPKTFFDFPITEKALHTMRIVTSPLFSNGNYELLSALLKEYELEDNWKSSCLSGLIK